MLRYDNVPNLIADLMPFKDDSAKCIAILKSALDEGFEFFKDFNVGMLTQLGNPDVIKFYLDRSVPVVHLLAILQDSIDYPEIIAVCFNHKKFPENPLQFSISNDGETFGNFCKKYLAQKYVDTSERREHVFNLEFINFIFKKYADWLARPYEVASFKNIVMEAYLKAEDADRKKIARDTLLVVCKHPAYPFPQMEEQIARDQDRYPFYWAAITDDKEIFEFFYFHAETLDEFRKIAIEKANTYKNPGLLDALALAIATKRMRDNKHLFTFYMAMMHTNNASQFLGNNRDVLVAMMQAQMQADYYVCLEYLRHDKLPFYDEGQQPKASAVLCSPAKASKQRFIPIETVDNKPTGTNFCLFTSRVVSVEEKSISNDLFLDIGDAVQRAIKYYRDWYQTGESYRGKSGWLAWKNHGANGLMRADLLQEILNAKPQKSAALINMFLTDANTSFHNHSLSQFLLDQLMMLNNSPWADAETRFPRYKRKSENVNAIVKNLCVGKK